MMQNMNTARFPSSPSGKNQRPCPAVQGFISSAECGAQRGSKLNCPAHCPFYPFGTAAGCYDLWLKLDATWGPKAFSYARQRVGKDRFAQIVKAHRSGPGDSEAEMVNALSAALYRVLFFERDANDRTSAERWEAEGWTGLNNDERVLMQYRRHSFVTVIEVQKVLDHQSARCVDVLSPGSPPFILYDRTAMPQMVRFTRLLSWVTHYPHFSRLAGAALEVPFELWHFWKELVENRFAREQTTQPGLTLRELLARDLIWATDILRQVGLGFRERLFAGMDFHQCVAIYRLTGDGRRVAAVLDSKPDFEQEEPSASLGFARPLSQYAWLRRGESAGLDQSMNTAFQHPSPEQSVGTVGNVRLYPHQLVIEVFSKKKYAFARQMIGKLFGSLVQFQKETIVDLAEMELGKEPKAAISGEVSAVLDKAFTGRHRHRIEMDTSREFDLPPQVAFSTSADEPGPTPSQQTMVERMLQRQYRAILDDRIPALDGRTPRECARDPARRAKLIEWMKGHLHQIESNNRRDSTHFSINWVVKELGLTELQ